MTDENMMLEKTDPSQIIFTPEKMELIKRQIAKDCTNDELQLFIYQCQRMRLDPFAKQIYAIKMDKQMVIMTSIDAFRLNAERSGKYQGQAPIEWCGNDGVWKDIWISDEPPYAARATIYRTDFKDPIVAVAKYKSYVRMVGDRPMKMWATMPEVMLGKCAESLALRKAFPQELSGIYTIEEMDQSKTVKASVLPPKRKTETETERKSPAQEKLTKEQIQLMFEEMFADVEEEKSFLRRVTSVEKTFPDGTRKIVGGLDTLDVLTDAQVDYITPAIQAAYAKFKRDSK